MILIKKIIKTLNSKSFQRLAASAVNGNGKSTTAEQLWGVAPGLDALITSKKTTAEETSDSEPPVIRRTERKKEGVGHWWQEN